MDVNDLLAMVDQKSSRKPRKSIKSPKRRRQNKKHHHLPSLSSKHTTSSNTSTSPKKHGSTKQKRTATNNSHKKKTSDKTTTMKTSKHFSLHNKNEAAEQHKNSNLQRLLVLGKYNLMSNRYGSTSSFNHYLAQALCKVNQKGDQKRLIPHHRMWQNTKVECLTFPCERLRDAIGDGASGGAGRLGLQLLAAEEEGWPYTYVMIVDDFEPMSHEEQTVDVLGTVKDILSAAVQNSSCNIILCVLPCQEQEQALQQQRPQLSALQGLTLHTNGFAGWKHTTEIMVYNLDARVHEMTAASLLSQQLLPPVGKNQLQVQAQSFPDTNNHNHSVSKSLMFDSAGAQTVPLLLPIQLKQTMSKSKSKVKAKVKSTVKSKAKAKETSFVCSDDANFDIEVDADDDGYRQDDEDGLRTVREEEEEDLLSVADDEEMISTTQHAAIVPATPEDNSAASKLEEINKQLIHQHQTSMSVANMRLKRGRKWIAQCIATFAINNTEAARRHRITISKLAHEAQRERLDELRRGRIEDEEEKKRANEEQQKVVDELARHVAAVEAAKAGLPAKIARQKRIAWEKWLAGEQKREKKERKEMAVAEEETKQVWEDIRAIAVRRYKARQRDLEQGRRRIQKVDRAILKVLSTNQKAYLKQQAKMTDADKELREIEAENMKKLGKKQKPLLDGWVTRKKMMAQAFAKLPFVCSTDDLFKRVSLAVYLHAAELTYSDPELDSNFGMVSCTQGSSVVTFTGKRPLLNIGSPFCIKGDLFTVVAFNHTSVTLGPNGGGLSTFSKTSGSYKAQFLEEGKVDKYRLIPEEERPPLQTLVMQPVDNDGRLW